MKSKIIISLFIASFISLNCYAASSDVQSFQNKLQSIKVETPGSISAQANQYNSSFYSEFASNPLLNSTMNGYSNMIQGMTGASYNMQEQVKQQMDYTRQQMQNNSNTEEE